VVAGIILPGLIGLAITRTWEGFVLAALWGGLVRFFFSNHITYSVNSIGHYFGRRRFETPDESRNVAWLSILSFGESWHNNHHAFPRSANHGMRWWEIDISAMVIRALAAVGLAWDVIHIDEERMERRAEGLLRVGGGRLAAAQPPEPLAERKDAMVGVADVE
jgi:stearoyl-CoA desaturase (Delta-9 desaturase)